MATQNAARAQKVEIVDEVKTRMGAATAQIVSEYRGLSVAELAELRTALEGVGADYRIFKNTLVRLAIDGGEYQPLSEYLTGPTALTFVDGRHQRRGQGAARLLPGEPAPGDQGRAGRRVAPVVRRTWPRWPTCRPARCCWPAWPVPWPRRCSRWPACSRPCPATWPTACRP